MSLQRSRDWTQSEDQDLIKIITQAHSQGVQPTWNQIANLMQKLNCKNGKIGKQCRERWSNHLNPNIKKNENWTTQQNMTLFTLHCELGNKWSQIAHQLPGRTDYCVKNHFHATIKQGLKKLNSYIQNVRSKQKTSKTVKPEVLNKILAVYGGKKDKDYQLKHKAKDISIQIKNSLIRLALDTQLDYQNIQYKDYIFQMICQFCRNCRRKKTKKLDPDSFTSLKSQQWKREKLHFITGNQKCKQQKLVKQESQPMKKQDIINISPPINILNERQIKVQHTLSTNISQSIYKKDWNILVYQNSLFYNQFFFKPDQNCHLFRQNQVNNWLNYVYNLPLFIGDNLIPFFQNQSISSMVVNQSSSSLGQEINQKCQNRSVYFDDKINKQNPQINNPWISQGSLQFCLDNSSTISSFSLCDQNKLQNNIIIKKCAQFQ